MSDVMCGQREEMPARKDEDERGGCFRSCGRKTASEGRRRKGASRKRKMNARGFQRPGKVAGAGVRG